MTATLGQLARVFLRLGTTAFGGPAAHIAMMDELIVRERGWITRERFLDLVGAANLIPGPSSTEVAIHIGYDQRGMRGLLVAGTCFIVPAMLLTCAIAALYVRYGARPEAAWLLYGIKPVIIAVVAQALWNLGRSAVRSWQLGTIGAAATAAALLGIDAIAIIAIAAALAAASRLELRSSKRVLGFAPFVAGASTTSFGLGALFLTFLKIGAVSFGSGYVLLAFLRDDFVDRLHWLTESQLLDAVAAGQLTPGPLFTTATFIGYILAGASGAAVATLAIFVPAFGFVALSGPLIPRLRRSKLAAAALDGVNVASLGLMLAVTLVIGRAALVDYATMAIAMISVVLLVRFKLGSVWLVAAGAALGLAHGWAWS